MTVELLRASTMSLHVGLGSFVRNVVTTYSRHSDWSLYFLTSSSGSPNFQANVYDLFCAGRKRSSTSAVSAFTSILSSLSSWQDGFDLTSSSSRAAVLAADSTVSEIIETRIASYIATPVKPKCDGDIPVVSGTISRVEVESGKWAASSLIASLRRLTVSVLRASTMTLHVGLGSSWFRNISIMWRSLSFGCWYVVWIASTSRGLMLIIRPNRWALFCASSSSSSIFPASSGISVSSTAGAVFAFVKGIYKRYCPAYLQPFRGATPAAKSLGTLER